MRVHPQINHMMEHLIPLCCVASVWDTLTCWCSCTFIFKLWHRFLSTRSGSLSKIQIIQLIPMSCSCGWWLTEETLVQGCSRHSHSFLLQQREAPTCSSCFNNPAGTKKASRTSSLHGITRGYCVFSRWLKSNSSRLSEAIIWFLDEARLYLELEFPRHVPALVHPPQMCVVYFSSTLCDLVCMCIDSEWKGALYGIHVVKRAILLAVIILFSMVVLTVTAYQAMHWSTHST